MQLRRSAHPYPPLTNDSRDDLAGVASVSRVSYFKLSAVAQRISFAMLSLPSDSKVLAAAKVRGKIPAAQFGRADTESH